MIPALPPFAVHDRSVPRSYVVARAAFTAASLVMLALSLTMIVLGIVNGAWGVADGTGFVVPAWLVIALGCVPPVASVVLFATLRWERVGDIIGFLAPTILLFVVMPIGFAVLYPDPSGVHWDPNGEYMNPDDPRARIGWHWIAALLQPVTLVVLLTGVLRFERRRRREVAAARAAFKEYMR